MMGNCQVRFLGEEGAATFASLPDTTRQVGLDTLILVPLIAWPLAFISMDERAFYRLNEYLLKVPAIVGSIGSGSEDDRWWVKFTIDIKHELAWHVVQELGHVLNYLSLDERLPTVFKPVSPPPYMNGGPNDYLSWVIECHDLSFTPKTVAEWLEGRLPGPVEELEEWLDEDS